jgi:DNA-binding CsgD family transcriptional regulator
MADIIKQTAQLDALTGKQREVLALVAEGMTSKEIARKLGISESAVNQRIEVIRQRLGGMSRSSIGRLYRQTSTLVFTIPTGNSLTGKAIQLQREGEFDQHLQSEGAEDFEAPAEEAPGVLQPSTFSPFPVIMSSGARRVAAAFALAIALLVIAVLVLAVAHSLAHLRSGIE